MAQNGRSDEKDMPMKLRTDANTEASSEGREHINAATAYGLEDHVANAQDPRVNALRLAEQNQAERRASHGSTRSSDVKKQPVTIPSHRDSRATTDNQLLPSNAAINYGLEDHNANQQDPRVEGIRHSQQKIKRGMSEIALHRQHASPSASGPVALSNLSPHSPPTSFQAMSTALPRNLPSASRPATSVAPIQTAPPSTLSKTSNHDAEESVPATDRPQDVPLPPPTMYTPPPTQTPPAISSAFSAGSSEIYLKHKEKADGCCSKLINTDITFDPSKDFACKTTNTLPDTMGVLYPDLETDGDDGSKDTSQTDMQAIQTTHLELDECFEMAIKVVKQAGVLTLAANKQRQDYTTKQHEHDLLTHTDNDVENMLMAAIIKRYPDHKFICEEAVSQTETGQVELTNDPTWIIDPIDGTMNFVHHFPYYCISVAFLVDKTTQFGIVYNPPMKDCYSARRGMGACLNGKPITTSGQLKLQHAMILQEYSSGMNDARNVVVMDNAKKLLKKTHAMRSIGSSAMGLAMIASGVADGFYFFGLHIWDMAAGNLLVTEAGGTVIDPDGGKLDIMSRRCLAAATEPLARELVAELIQNYPSPRDDQPKSINPNEYLPSGEKVDFIAQTEFTDSSESLVTESSVKEVYDRIDTNKTKGEDKNSDNDSGNKGNVKNNEKESNRNNVISKSDTDKERNNRRGKSLLSSREANANLGPNFIK